MIKKGATHADWAISLGLFLVYILSMFMILQPGVQPIYKEEDLLSLVESNVLNSTRMVVTKTLLVIKPIPENFTYGLGSYNVLISAELPMEKDGNKAAIFSEDNVYVQNSWVDKTTNEIKFVTDLKDGLNKFWVYEIISPDKESDDYKYDNFYNPVPGKPVVSNEDNNFTLYFGAPETVEGVDENVLTTNVLNNGIKCDDKDQYKVLKNRWHYPLGKDFLIDYIKSSDPRYNVADVIDVCKIANQPAQASIFIHELVTKTVNKNLEQEPIRINIKVW